MDVTGLRPDRVVLVRHGATEWSQTQRHTGWTDLPLNGDGLQQASALAAPLSRLEITTVLCSPLQRARSTCAAAGFAEQAVIDPDLREWNYGVYEGRTSAEIREHVPGWTIWDNGVIGGEKLHDVAARADRVVERLHGLDGTVAVFAHGHLLRVLASRWIGVAPGTARHLTLSTASISMLGWEHTWPAITLWNDVGHLERPA